MVHRKLGRALLIAGIAFGATSSLQAQTGGGGGIGSSGGGIGSTGGGIGSSGGGSGASGNQGGAGRTGGSGNTGGNGNAGGAPGTFSGIPTSSNIFAKTFGNPMGTTFAGVITPPILPSGPSLSEINKAFGQPLYSTTTGGAGVGGGTRGIGTGGLGQGQGQGSSTNNSFNTVGIRRAPAFATVLSPDLPLVKHVPAEVHAELVRTLETSTFLKEKNIQVAMEGGLVVLKGLVANDRERRIAEGFVRMTPGVREVRNELIVPATMGTPE